MKSIRAAAAALAAIGALCVAAIALGGGVEDAGQEAQVEAALQAMSPYERVCQLFLIKPESIVSARHVTKAGAATRRAMAEYPVGGFIYFSGNITSAGQIAQMIDTVQEISRENVGVGLFIGVDEEGGTITRVSGKIKDFPQFDTLREIGARGDTQEAYALGQALGEGLSALHFNVDFAPVADVLVNGRNTEIGARSFGSDAQQVADMVQAQTRGLIDGGVMPCIKHFPGMGSSRGNSHTGESVSTRTLEEIRETELIPFRRGVDAGAEMVMVSHVTYEAIDRVPASLSGLLVTDILRGEMGFDGVVITDALRMQAISDKYASAAAAVRAIEAGADMLLMPTDARAAIKGVYEAVKDGRISQQRIDESVRRVLRLKQKMGLIGNDRESTEGM